MASTRNWTLDGILSQGSNFQAAHRVSVMSDTLSQTIQEYDRKGIPLVIEGFHKNPRWPQQLFTLDKFVAGTSPNIQVRNILDCTDSTLPVGEFISKCRLSNVCKTSDEEARFYGKDAECPKDWEQWLQNGGVMPKVLLSKGKEDLFRCRPDNPEATVETLMCYLGIGDTFTPCHKDLCASSGQNLMCYTERDGSSFWFMTESSSAPAVAEYFREQLGQELDNENYIATIEDLKNAPFTVYVLRQRLGDMVLVPPRSCHQVLNSGGITVKTSWSRMTLNGLLVAYHYELSIYRRVGRPETYRIKSTIYHALVWMTDKLQDLLKAETKPSLDNSKCESLVNDLKTLLSLYDRILVEEYEDDSITRKQILYASDTFNDDIGLICDFCSGDIFQSFFECRQCCDSADEPCQLCPGCYIEGRNCKCGNMQPMQYQDFQHLVNARVRCVDTINAYEMKHDRNFERPLALGKFHEDFPALFQAACIRHRNQLDPKRAGKICKWKGRTHETKPHWAFNCKKCHNGKCFPHILADCNLHSAEVLLYNTFDMNHDEYHRLHLNSKMRFQKGIDVLRHNLKEGTPPQGSGYLLLAENATLYRFARPRNAKYMISGWYDTPLHVITMEAIQMPTPISLTASSERSSSEETTVEALYYKKATSNIHAELSSISPALSQKMKREQPFFVDVPKAPYDVSPGLRSVKSSKNLVPHANLISSSVARCLRDDDEYRPGPSRKKWMTGSAVGVSKTRVSSSQQRVSATSGVRASSTKGFGIDIDMVKSSKKPNNFEPPPNIKIGPPTGVARAAKSSRLPVNACYHKRLPGSSSKTSVSDVPEPSVLQPFPSSLTTLLSKTSRSQLQISGAPTPTQNHHISVHGPKSLSLTSEKFGDSSQDSQKRSSSDIGRPIHPYEAILIKKRKLNYQPDRETEVQNKIETGKSFGAKNSGTKDIMHNELKVDGVKSYTWNGQEHSWRTAYYHSTVPCTQPDASTPMIKWSSTGVDASQITLSSLQLQAGSETSVILTTMTVNNTAMTTDGTAADDQHIFEGITHSPFPRSPLLPDLTLPDGEGTNDLWGETMMSPSSFFEVSDINFDNSMAL